MKIDVHAHIVDRRYLDELSSTLALETERTDDGQLLFRHRGATIAWSREDMFDIGGRLKTMDSKGIDQRILSLSTPNVYLWDEPDQIAMARHINDALARICKQHPDRFIGLASLPLKNVEASLIELDRAIQELDMKGVIIGSNVDGAYLDAPHFAPLWEKIDRLRLPVFEHPMFPRSNDGFEGYELPLRLGMIFDTTLAATRFIYSGLFERYPNFPYILAHTGGALLMALERLDNGYRLFPDCRQHISRLPSEYASRLYYDTTAFGKNALDFALSTIGTSQLLFGTDDPFIGASPAHVEALSISQADKAAVFGGNAARVFGL
ncbi:MULTISPECIES: amidohydrolase family protein [unclassified Beijerinckia]|uniref:amidohydrolase family protein n=1 Tax=unclassified Beijerinckia TaxID=2638183 RepID=UPI00147C28CE|nr:MULTISPECIES: amidohydrolase family protein [unclassified Beijerinckia]